MEGGRGEMGGEEREGGREWVKRSYIHKVSHDTTYV